MQTFPMDPDENSALEVRHHSRLFACYCCRSRQSWWNWEIVIMMAVSQMQVIFLELLVELVKIKV